MTVPEGSSPRWTASAKAIVTIAGLAVVAALLVRFKAIVPLLVVAGIVSYVALPFVRALHNRARLSWALATNIIFVYLLALLVLLFTAAGLAAVQQLQALFSTLQTVLGDLPGQLAALSQEPLTLGPWTLKLTSADIMPLAERALSTVQPVFGRASSLLATVATGAIETLAKLVFVLAVAYFVTMDSGRLRSAWAGLTIPRYDYDFARLRQALERIWEAFLRGQLIIVLVTGTLMGLLMGVLGVRFAVGLGVLMGLAKFIPIVGPTAAGTIAALVALLQPTNEFNLTPWAFALLTAGLTIVMDQSVDYLLVPRIMGSSLNLHPVLVLVGAIVGAALAGIVGLLLSAPAMATLVLLGRYTWRKLVDLPPWDPPIDAVRAWTPPALPRLLSRRRGRGKRPQPPPEAS